MKKGSLAYEIVMTALVLVLIAGVAGALLGFVHHFAAVDPNELLLKKASAVYDGKLKDNPVREGLSAKIEYENGDVLDVLVPSDESVKDVFILHVKGTGAYKGSLELLVNITKGKIVKIAKYDANETPGLGSKALEDSYFRQYCGVPITAEFSGFTLLKTAPLNETEVRAISGASKSSTAVTNAVNAAVVWYQNAVLKGGAR
ncbi:MAG: FMN-binding protein [Clostridia bacterium]|nr:FMN-binding protein [Clostridia bacterium]